MSPRFFNIISSDKPVLVDFYADWCAPCKMMHPVLKEIKDQYKENIKVIKVNVDRNPKIAEYFRIKGIPTLLLFKQGQVKWTGLGVQTFQDISLAIDGQISTTI